MHRASILEVQLIFTIRQMMIVYHTISKACIPYNAYIVLEVYFYLVDEERYKDADANLHVLFSSLGIQFKLKQVTVRGCDSSVHIIPQSNRQRESKAIMLLLRVDANLLPRANCSDDH